MKQYMKKIITFMLICICFLVAVPSTTAYAKTAFGINATRMTMTRGERIALRIRNGNENWTADQRYVKIQTSETGRMNVIALRVGTVVLKEQSSGFTVKIVIVSNRSVQDSIPEKRKNSVYYSYLCRQLAA